MIPLGVVQQQQLGFPIPTSGLVSMLDGSVAGSMWQDSGKTTPAAEGDPLGCWEDQSGNGNDWVQTNASYKPIAQPDSGRIYCVGTQDAAAQDHLVGPNISAWTEGSFFARVYSNGTQAGCIWGTTTWSSASSANHWLYGGSAHYFNFGMDSRPNVGGVVSNGVWLSYENNISVAGNGRIYVNGSSVHNGSYSAPSFRSTPVIGGGIRTGAVQYCGLFYFGKFCCYNRIVTADERTQIGTWLSS